MVSRKTKKCPTIVDWRRRIIDSWGIVVLVMMFLMILAFVVGVGKFDNKANVDEILDGCPTISGNIVEDGCAEEITGFKKIDFQPVVDEWVKSVGGKKGILIYDLATDEIVGEYNANEKFATASVYKLFVVYEGYRRLQSGLWDANDTAGITRYTILQCLDLAIRESNSPCAETLWAMIGRDELDDIIQNDLGLTGVIVGSFSATPNEIMKMMRYYYRHTELENEIFINTMMDSFLNQPVTNYDWRQGLPSGFSDKVNVYNKVGWEYGDQGWKIYDDAAIVEFTSEKRDFIVVVMTSGVPYQKIRELGTQIEQAFYASMY